MTAVRERNESAWLLPNDGSRTNHRLRSDMRRFADSDTVDLVVVGCGAGGSTLLQRLARQGWRVVGLDAGPFWDPDADWVSDEAGSQHLYWTEPRVIRRQARPARAHPGPARRHPPVAGRRPPETRGRPHPRPVRADRGQVRQGSQPRPDHPRRPRISPRPLQALPHHPVERGRP
jgi:hypothetical protein